MPVQRPVISSYEQCQTFSFYIIAQLCTGSLQAVHIPLFKKFQVVLLPVGIIRNSFQSSPKKCLTHSIQIDTQGVQTPDRSLWRIRSETGIITCTGQRIAQDVPKTQRGEPV